VVCDRDIIYFNRPYFDVVLIHLCILDNAPGTGCNDHWSFSHEDTGNSGGWILLTHQLSPGF
jgi:hypothetical protein